MASGGGVSQIGPRQGVLGGFHVLGLPEAIAKLTGVGRIARISLGITMREAAQLMESQARANIHSLTGNLASGTKAYQVGSYSWMVSSSSLDGDVAEKNNKEYAGFVENGTQYMEGQFYMKRAFDATQAGLNAKLVIIAREIELL